ncbi:hypothetical protein BDW59DRAFT_165748 [Aspergillus cavernicola]|uniref:Uncharacterized protein n=1 Tax=Aspergillus cavernicola TaxID=176166 RepID=A0ABR4HR07_9EURO
MRPCTTVDTMCIDCLNLFIELTDKDFKDYYVMAPGTFPVYFAGIVTGKITNAWLEQVRDNMKVRVKETFNLDVKVYILLVPNVQQFEKHIDLIEQGQLESMELATLSMWAQILLDFSGPVIVDTKLREAIFKDLPKGHEGWGCRLPSATQCASSFRLSLHSNMADLMTMCYYRFQEDKSDSDV